MFENLSQRERTLAIAAGSLVPLAVLCFGFLWLTSSLNGYDEQIAALNSEINQAKTLHRNKIAATGRQKTYQSLSLASNPQQALAEYRNWAIALSDRTFGKDVTPLEAPKVISAHSKFRDPTRPTLPPRQVYSGWAITVNVASTTLDKLNQFLYEFYRAPILHRIKSLTITPLAGNPGGSSANLPTGKLGVTFEIEAIAVAEAAADKAISTRDVVQSEREREWYQKQIEQRNMFGLPNNPPQITSGNQSEYEGREIALSLNARDEDANDRLTFELLETDVPGGALKQRDATSKSAQFTAGEVPPGDYKIRVRVTDSGLPNKYVDKEIALQVKQKEPEPEVKPVPPFYHARETQITAILRENDGVDRVWVYIRTLDERFPVAAGESFEVDGKQWTVIRIEPRSVTLEVDGKQRVLKVGDKLGADSEDPRYSTTPTGGTDESQE